MIAVCFPMTQTEEQAEHLEVGRETIRFHLKNICRKTDARSQSELVALILSSLARFEDRE